MRTLGLKRRFFAFSLALVLLSQHALFAASSLDTWMEYEQKRVDRGVEPGKIMQPTIDGLKQEFRPETAAWFDLPSIWVPEKELDVVSVQELIPEELRAEFVRTRDGVREYRLFIHPESMTYYEPLISKYPLVTEHRATPTSSSRTLRVRSIAHPEREAFVKVSLAVKLGGVLRTVLRSETARAVGTTAYLRSIRPNLSTRFELQDEPLGIVPKSWEDGGQLVRTISSSVKGNQVVPVPLFSLYAASPDGALLESLAKKAGVSEPEFIQRYINQPLSEGWADWAVNGSVIMEPHAQNVLLELGPDGKPNGKLLLRDLGGFNLDLKSPTFVQSHRSELQFIKSVDEDYWQDRVQALHNYSLKTYYESGFLYNVEKYLSEKDPKYVKGSVTQDFWQDVTRALKQVSGYENFTEADLRNHTYIVLTQARTSRAKMPPQAICVRTIQARLRESLSKIDRN